MATRVQDARRPLQIGPAETWQAQVHAAQADTFLTDGRRNIPERGEVGGVEVAFRAGLGCHM